MSLVQEITTEIAAREGLDPENLETPLNDVIEVDVLEALATGSEEGVEGQSPVLEFVYYGYTVSVDAEATVSISDHADATGDDSVGPLEESLGTLAAEMESRKAAMEDAADVIAARERPFGERLDGVLEVVRRHLGVDYATLSYVNDGNYVFESVDVPPDVDLGAGETAHVADTVCNRVVETERELVFGDVATDAPELAETAYGVSCYIGVPVFVAGGVYGTFCFYDTEPREDAFAEWDLAFVELLSKWVSSELERRDRARSLHACRTQRPYPES